MGSPERDLLFVLLSPSKQIPLILPK